MDWHEDALCLEIGTGLFFSEEGEGNSANRALNQAKRACQLCPVRRECLNEALAYEGDEDSSRRWGIWGGLGPAQRQKLHKAKQEES